MILKERDKLGGIVACVYLLPLFLITGYAAKLFSPERSLALLGLGFILTALGTIIFFWLMERREKLMRQESYTLAEVQAARQKPTLPPEEPNEELPHLQQLLESQTIQMESLKSEREKLLHRIDDLVHEFQDYKKTAEEELEHQKGLYRESQETVSEQRAVINRKQQQIGEFESKVHDLNYEVKTLLKLADFGSSGEQKRGQPKQFPPPEKISEPAIQQTIKEQLKRCIDIAQKITGASPFGGGGLRFRELNIDNYALDLRRLCDALKSETSSPIVVWSQKENKLLFANPEIKNLLGWNAEQFVQDFRSLVHQSLHDWQDGISELQAKRECCVDLMIKNKSGQTIPIHCHLRTIPSGIFRSHAIGILYSGQREILGTST